MTKMLSFLLGGVALTLVPQTSAQSAEPLVWTDLADPDPNFVPPPEPRPARPATKPRNPRAQPKEQEAYEAGRSLAETLEAIEKLERAVAQSRKAAEGAPGFEREPQR